MSAKSHKNLVKSYRTKDQPKCNISESLLAEEKYTIYWTCQYNAKTSSNLNFKIA